MNKRNSCLPARTSSDLSGRRVLGSLVSRNYTLLNKSFISLAMTAATRHRLGNSRAVDDSAETNKGLQKSRPPSIHTTTWTLYSYPSPIDTTNMRIVPSSSPPFSPSPPHSHIAALLNTPPLRWRVCFSLLLVPPRARRRESPATWYRQWAPLSCPPPPPLPI